MIAAPSVNLTENLTKEHRVAVLRRNDWQLLSANEIQQVCNNPSLELKLQAAATYKYHGYTSYETCTYVVIPTISYLYLEIFLRRGPHVEP